MSNVLIVSVLGFRLRGVPLARPLVGYPAAAEATGVASGASPCGTVIIALTHVLV